jgi:hypothetical protein
MHVHVNRTAQQLIGVVSGLRRERGEGHERDCR